MNVLLKDLVFNLCKAGANYLLAHARTKAAGFPLDVIDPNVFEDIAIMQYNTLEILGFWQLLPNDINNILDDAIEDAKIYVGSSDYYTKYIACEMIVRLGEQYEALYFE